MTADELARIGRWVLDRWPGATAWKSPDRFFEDFVSLRYGPTLEAVSAMFQFGQVYPPTPSEVLADARRRGAVQRITDPICRRHVWAILDEHPETGDREAMCSVCHLTREFAAGSLQTAGETAT